MRSIDLRSPVLASLNLKLVAGHQGLQRPIDWPRVQKPGLAIAGFLDYVKENRVQILGASEFNYLKTLPPSVARERLDAFTKLPLSAVVVTKGIHPGPVLTGLCRRRHIPLFTTERLTSVVIEGLTAFLEESLAPRATLHGVLMEVGGLGTLLLGDSGVGKSECALSLVQRGHRLVADDLVVVQRFPNDVLIGSSSGLIRHHMELRGLGIVNVPMLFGVAAVLERHTVEFVIQLQDWNEQTEVDRLGLDEEFEEILGVAGAPGEDARRDRPGRGAPRRDRGAQPAPEAPRVQRGPGDRPEGPRRDRPPGGRRPRGPPAKRKLTARERER